MDSKYEDKKSKAETRLAELMNFTCTNTVHKLSHQHFIETHNMYITNKSHHFSLIIHENCSQVKVDMNNSNACGY